MTDGPYLLTIFIGISGRSSVKSLSFLGLIARSARGRRRRRGYGSGHTRPFQNGAEGSSSSSLLGPRPQISGLPARITRSSVTAAGRIRLPETSGRPRLSKASASSASSGTAPASTISQNAGCLRRRCLRVEGRKMPNYPRRSLASRSATAYSMQIAIPSAPAETSASSGKEGAIRRLLSRGSFR
jgi:hypothetical protein